MLPGVKATTTVFSALFDPLVVGRERAEDITVRGTKSAEDRVEIWELATLGLVKPRNSGLALSIVEQGKSDPCTTRAARSQSRPGSKGEE